MESHITSTSLSLKLNNIRVYSCPTPSSVVVEMSMRINTSVLLMNMTL